MTNESSKVLIVKFLESLAEVVTSQPFEKTIDVYSVNDRMFLLINNKDPIIISLRCDKTLSEFLQNKYESVMPGQRLDSDKWISIVDSGQMTIEELKDLVILSYNLAKESI
jgi:predicted DNA-binding protein (MmcQ/YjbR family)